MTRRSLLWRAGTWLLLAILTSGCDKKPISSGPIFFEFKQQPGDKYVYKVADEVFWSITDTAGKVNSIHHQQEQKSIMKFTQIDSNAVRWVQLSFIIERDTILSASDLPWRKKRQSPVGRKFEFQLRMKPNGGILAVESHEPSLTFFYDASYRPSQPEFPERAIPLGYAWTQNFEIPVPGGEPSAVAAEYKFSSLERIDEFDCAVIDFKSELEYMETSACKETECVLRYQCRTTSAGKLYFAYREGFVVKKVNVLTSHVKTSKLSANGRALPQSQTEMRDHETITLAAIYRSIGEKLTYQIE